MKLRSDQIDKHSLSSLGEEAAAMLMLRNYAGLASRFGYALAYGRKPEEAIEYDVLNATSALQVAARIKEPSIMVKYFQPNRTNLVAVVECIVPLDSVVILELVVTAKGDDLFITLEDIADVA